MTVSQAVAGAQAVPLAGGAEALARQLHSGQVDRAGRPYFEHLASVVSRLVDRWPEAPQHARDAAWLHDVLEDTQATPQSLLRAGVSPEALVIIQAVTRPEGITYLKWIANLAANGGIWEIRVKLADNEDNSDSSRRLPGSNLIERRYVPARLLLMAGRENRAAK